MSSLKSSITRKAYEIRLKNYLRTLISFSTFDELLTRNPLQIEQGVIDIIIEMRYKRQMSFSPHMLNFLIIREDKYLEISGLIESTFLIVNQGTITSEFSDKDSFDVDTSMTVTGIGTVTFFVSPVTISNASFRIRWGGLTF